MSDSDNTVSTVGVLDYVERKQTKAGKDMVLLRQIIPAPAWMKDGEDQQIEWVMFGRSAAAVAKNPAYEKGMKCRISGRVSGKPGKDGTRWYVNLVADEVDEIVERKLTANEPEGRRNDNDDVPF